MMPTRSIPAAVSALLCALSFFATPSSSSGQAAPLIQSSFSNSAIVPTGSAQVQHAPNLSFPAGLPVQTTGPAEVTNATQIYVQFLSDSLGHTNLSDATANTGFHLAGASVASIPGIVDPPPNPNANNPFFVAVGTVKENQAWLMINYTPGTNSTLVTNRLQVIALNGNNNQTTNWALTNLNLIVRPPQPLPPHLEVRLYNLSTNAANQVFLLPTCKGLSGSGFWWSNALAANNWTNWMVTTTNMTVTLADIGISGTNAQGSPYYSIYMTHFPNAAWFVSYGGGHLKAPTNASGQWNGITYGAGPNIAQPTSSSTNGLWFGSEWNAFELTLDGNPEDVGDTTYINQFSIPMSMRSFTNNYADAEAGIYTNQDSSRYYRIGGWTNFNLSSFSNLVAQMVNTFSHGVIKNAAGIPVMVAGPSSAGNGALAPPWTPPPLTNNAQNVWPTFASYFDAVKDAQPGRKAKIKDFIGLAGNNSGPTYFFYYDFDLTVTASNALRLEGSMRVTNAPGSSGTFHTNAANLVLEIGADGGPNDNWASWSIYTAPTPANLTIVRDLFSLSDGRPSGLITNLTTYSAYATNGLSGTAVHLTGSNFLGAVQVAFCGANNTLLPAPYTVINDTNLTTHVPAGAESGPIVVTTLNGSGMSASSFMVDGTTMQTGPAVTPSSNTPAIATFSPADGMPATPICTVSGDWMAIAQASQTGPTHSHPTLVDLYNSPFGSAVMGRIAGDLAAGFAFGFINSDTSNPAYSVDGTNKPYGDSPSGSWWGGNEYPAANTNSLAYHRVNTHYSPWGDLIYAATPVTYGHPIYDRMKIYGGEYTTEVIQPPVALNNTPNIWVVEIDFYDGMARVAPKDGQDDFYTLVYQSGAGGTISGSNTQTIAAGQTGTPVTAVGVDTSVVFHAWNDGRIDNPRTDTDVHADNTVSARFRSRGGADLDWYADHGFTPAPTQVWSDLDETIIQAKDTTLLKECFADTDPAQTAAVFRLTGLSAQETATLHFEPSSTGRLYTVQYIGNLADGIWTNVPGIPRRPGIGGADEMHDTNTGPAAFYRIRVELP